MVGFGELALHLAPVALTSVVHAVGKAIQGSKPSSTNSILTDLELAAIRSDLAAFGGMLRKPQPVLKRFEELEKDKYGRPHHRLSIQATCNCVSSS
jgi:hypothetical protein